VFSDAHEAKLWAISENLHRVELTALERADQTAEWVKLTGRKVRQVAAVSFGGRGQEGGARAAARDLGVSDRDVRRALQIASLAPEAKQAARKMHLDDNQAALLEAAEHEAPADQIAALHDRAGGAQRHADPRATAALHAWYATLDAGLQLAVRGFFRRDIAKLLPAPQAQIIHLNREAG
jgi:hypothetical protein